MVSKKSFTLRVASGTTSFFVVVPIISEKGCSIGVDSLLTNIPLEETISICVDQLFLNNDNDNDLSKTEFHRILSLVTA